MTIQTLETLLWSISAGSLCAVVIAFAYEFGHHAGWLAGFREHQALTKKRFDESLRNVEPIQLDLRDHKDRELLAALLDITESGPKTVH